MRHTLHLQHFTAGASAPVEPGPVSRVLAEHGCDDPDEFGVCTLDFDDGGEVEVHARGLDGARPFIGCAINIREIGGKLAAFVFEVARAGNFVIFNSHGKDTADCPSLILLNSDQERELPDGMASEYSVLPVCTSAKMLGRLLFQGAVSAS
ncbi:MAG: hypothetical protein FJ303_16635 [Planctomycetes bacterium]|nr:hypothetical protein [Planctomycetota bacterium]